MDHYRSTTPDFISEARPVPDTGSHTPPYTPIARGKRRLERSDSPASASSTHPAETSSPATKTAKRGAAVDNVKVEELTEGDAGYFTDIDIIYPNELEEINSSDEGDDELSSSNSDTHSDATGIARRLAKLRCGNEDAEAKFEKERRRRHLNRRTGARVFKRTHSQTVKSDTEVTDADAIDDQDLPSSRRRLRRRVRGPGKADLLFEEEGRSLSEHDNADMDLRRMPSPESPKQLRDYKSQAAESDGMDIDDFG